VIAFLGVTRRHDSALQCDVKRHDDTSHTCRDDVTTTLMSDDCHMTVHWERHDDIIVFL